MQIPYEFRFKDGDFVFYQEQRARFINITYAKKSQVHWWARISLNGETKFVPAMSLGRCEIKETPRIRWYKQGKLIAE